MAKKRDQKLTPEEMSLRLEEAEQALDAIRTGQVDALLIDGPEGEKVYTLQGADHPYQVMVETMNEGAATLLDDGTILYCNRRLAEMMCVPLESLLGSRLADWTAPEDRRRFQLLLKRGLRESSKGEVQLGTDGSQMPALLSMSALPVDGRPCVCLVVTDLTDQKRYEEMAVTHEGLQRSEAHERTRAEELQRLNDELEAATEELQLQNRELVAIQTELRASEERYRSLFENMTEGFFLAEVICDEAGKPVDYRYLDTNPAFEPMTGIRRETIVGKTVREVLPGVEEYWIETYGRVALTGEPARIEQFAAPLGRYYETFAYSPRAGQFACLFADVTERKLAEQAAAAAHAEAEEGKRTLDALMEYVPEGITISDAPGVNIQRVSRYGRELLGGQQEGLSVEQVVEHWKVYETDGVTPMREEDLPLVRAIRRGEIVREQEVVQMNEQGQRLALLCDAAPIRSSTGEILGGIVAWRDITERKRAEQELVESRRVIREILESISDGFMALDCDWRFTYINRRAANNVGSEPEQLLGQNIWAKFPGLAEGELGQNLRRAMEEQETRSFEYAGVITDKTYSITIYPSPGGLSLYWQDITERKRVEREREHLLGQVREERDRAEAQAAELDATVNAIADATIIYAPDTRIVRMNAVAERLLGYTPEQTQLPVAQRNALVRTEWPDGRPFTEADLLPGRRALRGETVNNVQVAIRHVESGQAAFVSVSAAPIRSPEGEIRGAIVTLTDITQLHKTQQQLLAKNVELEAARAEADNAKNRLEAMMEALPVGVSIIDERGGVVRTNKAFEQVWGGPHPETESVDDYGMYQAWWADTGRALAPEEWASARAVQKGEMVVGQELEIQRFDGTRGFVINSASPVYDSSGQIIGSAVAIQDITERKRVEQALRESKETLRQRAEEVEKIMDLVPVAIWVGHDPLCNDITGNQTANQFYEAGEGENVSANATPMRRFFRDGRELAPEELPMQYAAIHDVEVTGSEFEALMPSGNRRFLWGYAIPLHHADGRVRGSIGAFVDITERRRAEQERERLVREIATAEERQRLARDLHDAVSQTLFAASTIADVLPKIWARDPAQAQRRLQELSRLNRGAFAEMRMLLLELRPNMLTQTPLPDLLAQLANAVTGRTQLAVTVDAKGELKPEADVHVALYRIAQEALNNIVKHSHATEAKLVLSQTDGQVVLSVMDNGDGFDLQEVSGQHMGLRIMRERAQEIGARLEILSGSGDGTHVKVVWTE